MKGLKSDFDRIAGEAGGLPMELALSGDLFDPAEMLLKLRALQSFDRGAVRYAIQRTYFGVMTTTPNVASVRSMLRSRKPPYRAWA